MKIFCFLLLCTSYSFAQPATSIDININNKQGTFVIRKITKDFSLSKDSSRLIIRIFMPFCRQLKGRGQYSIKMFFLDSFSYALNDMGVIDTYLRKGRHKLGIEYPHDPPFFPFKETTLKFKSRREYAIDIYLPAPFPMIHH